MLIQRVLPIINTFPKGLISPQGQPIIRFFRTTEKNHYLLRKNWKESTYRKYDKIPSTFTLIYRSSLDNYLRGCKHFSTASLVMGLGLLAYKFLSDEEQPLNFDMKMGPLVTDENELYVFCVAFLLVNVVIRITLYRLPTRIYKRDLNYIAVFHEKIPFVPHRVSFNRGDVSPLPPRGILPWRESRFMMKDRRCIFLSDCFRTSSEQFDMMRK